MPVVIPEVNVSTGKSSSDVYLHVQTKRAGKIKGEATMTGHEDDIVVSSWQWGLSASSAIGSTQATGRRSYTALTVQKSIDTSTTALMSALATNDLVKDMRAQHTPMRLPMVTALGLGMLAARAYGLAILDGVYNDIKDEEGFRAQCRQGVELGFDGKTLIHPSQVGPCNEIFAPSEAELAQSARIVAAFEAAQAAGKGVVTLDGRMIENLHVEEARRRLALAEAIR